MRLERSLVLNRFCLQLLGADSLDQLKGPLATQERGDDAGHSPFYAVLRGLGDQRRLRPVQRLEAADLERYDLRVMEYQDALARRRSAFSFKYFQYLALLFTEIFLDRLTRHPQRFLRELNAYAHHVRMREPLLVDLPDFTPDDLRRLAFFMATGAGKTLLLHVHLLQVRHYLKNGRHPEALVRRPDGRRLFDNVLLITPNEGLSRQHLEEFERSGIPAELLTRASRSGSLYRPLVRVIEISKLADSVSADGVSIPLEQLGTANLVFVDEGHKGTGSEAQAWKRKQKRLSEDGLLLEYSATFAQSIAAAGRARPDLLVEYGKAILFDYSYRHFYHDGYGKDFFVMNVAGGRHQHAHDVLASGVLLFFQQRRLRREHSAAFAPYGVEPPLWVFLGSSVNAGKQGRSDVAVVVDFLRRFIAEPDWAIGRLRQALEGHSGFADGNRDLLVPRIGGLQAAYGGDAEALYLAITDDLFHGRGALEVNELKNAQGELGLRVSAPGGPAVADKPYFGVINIGDVSEFKKHLKEHAALEVGEDRFSASLFGAISGPESKINLLVGAKKFIEGWSSWRVSCMGLLNIARSEGPQFLQLFGRGVRLKGREWSLKRSAFLPGPHPKGLEQLETLYILGWNADYISAFRKMLEEEEIGKEIELPVVPMEPWPGHLRVPRLRREYAPYGRTWVLHPKGLPARVDLTPTVTAVESRLTETRAAAADPDVARGHAGERTQFDFGLPAHRDLIELDTLHAELTAYKATRGCGGIFIPRDTLLPILERCELHLALADSREPARVQSAALAVLKAYLDRFARAVEREEQSANIEPVLLEQDDTLVRPYRLRVEAALLPRIQRLLADEDALFHDDEGAPLPRLHVERHLFNPLLLSAQAVDGLTITPTGLVKSERDFVAHLRSFWNRHHKLAEYRHLEIYLLRNLPRVGFGLFKRSGFYPDFLLWIEDRKAGSVRLLFVEPHGLGHQGVDAIDDKARAFDFLVKTSGAADFRAARMTMEGYILTQTPLDEIAPGQDVRWVDLERGYHVYWQDDAGDYIHTLVNGPRQRSPGP